MSLLGTGSIHNTERFKRPTQGPAAGAVNATCQKCLQRGHYTFQCKNDAVYSVRPTRTQQLLNPRTRERFLDPSELLDSDRPAPVPVKKAVHKRKRAQSTSSSSSSSSSSDSSDDSSSSSGSSSEDSSSSSDASSGSSSSDSSSSSSSDVNSLRSPFPRADSGSSSDSGSSGSESEDTPPRPRSRRSKRASDERRRPLRSPGAMHGAYNDRYRLEGSAAANPVPPSSRHGRHVKSTVVMM